MLQPTFHLLQHVTTLFTLNEVTCCSVVDPFVSDDADSSSSLDFMSLPPHIRLLSCLLL